MALIITPRQLTQRAHFYHQLSQLVAAGIGIVDALQMQSHNPPAASYRAPLRHIILQLHQGATFADAMVSVHHWTPAFDISLIRAAEKSGRLDAVFKLLGDYYADRAKILSQMISDLIYPVFVFHFAIILFPFLDYFKSSNFPLFLMRTIGVIIPLYAIVFFLIYASQGQRGEAWRAFYEKILNPVPILGSARRSLALARLCAALEALLSAGVNIIEAWEMASAASGSHSLHRTVSAWKPRVLAGQTPAEAVRAAPSQFPELFSNLYTTGEVSGTLDNSLRQLYAYYSDEGRRKLHALASWVPKIIYLGVAVLVAFRVINFFVSYLKEVQDAGGF